MPPPSALEIEALFAAEGSRALQAPAFGRTRKRLADAEVLVDHFAGTTAGCLFLRLPAGEARRVTLRAAAALTVADCPLGGWLLRPVGSPGVVYWVPQPAMARTLDADLHITAECRADVTGIELGLAPSGIQFDLPRGHALDVVVWRLPAAETRLVEEVVSPLLAIEKQPTFTYGSHSVLGRPADFYRHLVHGQVYDTEFVWPRHWRICDELDAYALWLTAAGLQAATGKSLYGLLKVQLSHSIVARQREDGGWYHGEWTTGMESHFRLHCGGIHLLCAALEEREDPSLRAALDRACAFLARQTDATELGTWFLHDSLERSEAAMKDCPFPWASTTVLGKSRPNMLVLNTHLDAQIALARHARICGTASHAQAVESARDATRAALALRPADMLYRLVFGLVDLTLLPAAKAMRLPLPLRAAKRLTWKYLTPRLHQLRARYPRFVMPSGYIDRSPTLLGVAHQYLPVNIWDLVRYRRLFPMAEADRAIRGAMEYIDRHHALTFWRETRNHKHALGFWAESLYHLAVDDSDPRLRSALAEAMLFCEDAGQGMPPSLLGANCEAVPPAARRPCPSPVDARLRVALLGDEALVVNVSESPVPATMVDSAGWDWPGGVDVVQPRGYRVARRRAAFAGRQPVDAGVHANLA